MEIYNDGETIKNDDYASAYGFKSFNTGIHIYKFKIKKYNGEKNNWNIVIGITWDHQAWDRYTQTFFHGYGFVGSKAKLIGRWKKDNYGDDYGCIVKSGDTIEMIVNLNNHTLSYKINLIKLTKKK